MKFTIDTTKKVITILEDVNYLELTKFVNQMLPIDEIPNYTIKVKTEYIQVTHPNYPNYPNIVTPLCPVCPAPIITRYESTTIGDIQKAIDAISNT